ncbi:MAG: CBS domain-containing protein, partial [Bdellovibrionales bacterium]|nr:CBS domain-containing protein [Bdellovibrionales bacterium]
IKHLGKKKQIGAAPFREKIKYSKKPKVIVTSTPLSEIVQLFVDFKYRRLPVVDENKKLVGVITRRDLMRVFFYRSKLP